MRVQPHTADAFASSVRRIKPAGARLRRICADIQYACWPSKLALVAYHDVVFPPPPPNPPSPPPPNPPSPPTLTSSHPRRRPPPPWTVNQRPRSHVASTCDRSLPVPYYYLRMYCKPARRSHSHCALVQRTMRVIFPQSGSVFRSITIAAHNAGDSSQRIRIKSPSSADDLVTCRWSIIQLFWTCSCLKWPRSCKAPSFNAR